MIAGLSGLEHYVGRQVEVRVVFLIHDEGVRGGGKVEVEEERKVGYHDHEELTSSDCNNVRFTDEKFPVMFCHFSAALVQVNSFRWGVHYGSAALLVGADVNFSHDSNLYRIPAER